MSAAASTPSCSAHRPFRRGKTTLILDVIARLQARGFVVSAISALTTGSTSTTLARIRGGCGKQAAGK